MDYKKYLRIIKNKIRPRRAVITQPDFPASEGIENKKTLLIVVAPTFNQKVLKAATMISNGFAKGWAKTNGSVKIVSADKLMREIEKHDDPALFMDVYNFDYLNLNESKKLRDYDNFICASIHPKKIEKLKKLSSALPATDFITWEKNYEKIVASEPRFVWNSVGNSGMEWYEDWINAGFRWETIFLAADDSIYFPEKNDERFGNIKMGYVGGYWPEKSQAFDLYLRRWEEIFTPFGYAQWPYKNYSGGLSIDEERQLYSSAKLIPLVTSPVGWLWAEMTERYFKAPACNAFCIADENPGVREIYNEDEMIQAKDKDHFASLVEDVLSGKIDTRQWADKAYQAVISRHLYTHRATQIRNCLESKR